MKKGMQERHVVDWLEVVGHPKADKETKTVSILYEIETYTKLIPSRGSSLHPRGYVELSTLPVVFAPQTFLSPSLLLSHLPSVQGTPTVFLHWTTSVGPWRWMVSWTEKTPSTLLDSLLLSRWAEWEAGGRWRDCHSLEEKSKVCFTDGSRESFDIIVYWINGVSGFDVVL